MGSPMEELDFKRDIEALSWFVQRVEIKQETKFFRAFKEGASSFLLLTGNVSYLCNVREEDNFMVVFPPTHPPSLKGTFQKVFKIWHIRYVGLQAYA